MGNVTKRSKTSGKDGKSNQEPYLESNEKISSINPANTVSVPNVQLTQAMSMNRTQGPAILYSPSNCQQPFNQVQSYYYGNQIVQSPTDVSQIHSPYVHGNASATHVDLGVGGVHASANSESRYLPQVGYGQAVLNDIEDIEAICQPKHSQSHQSYYSSVPEQQVKQPQIAQNYQNYCPAVPEPQVATMHQNTDETYRITDPQITIQFYGPDQYDIPEEPSEVSSAVPQEEDVISIVPNTGHSKSLTHISDNGSEGSFEHVYKGHGDQASPRRQDRPVSARRDHDDSSSLQRGQHDPASPRIHDTGHNNPASDSPRKVHDHPVSPGRNPPCTGSRDVREEEMICTANLENECASDLCCLYHKNRIYQWQYRVLDQGEGNADWIDFDDNRNEFLEKRFCDPVKEHCSLPFQNEGIIKVNFVNMTVCGSQHQTVVRRLSTPSSEAPEMTSEMSEWMTIWLWYWEQSRGVWVQFGQKKRKGQCCSADSGKIERSYQENPRGSVVVSIRKSKHRLYLASMEEEHLKDKVRSRIRRRPQFVRHIEIYDDN